MPARAVAEWVSKYADRMGKVDWVAASAEWARMKPTFIANYTGAAGLNPNIAAKYRSAVEKATHRAPDVTKAVTNYRAKMTVAGA